MTVLIILIAVYLFSLFALTMGEKKAGRFWNYADRFFLSLAILCHTVVIVLRGLEANRFPLTDTYETLLLFSLIVIVVGTIMHINYKFVEIKKIAVLTTSFLLFFSLFLSASIKPLMPSLKSGWLFFHVGAYFIAYASFAIGFGLGLVFIVLSAQKKKGSEYDELMEKLEGVIFRVIDVGFPLLTIGIATGAVWANLSWGRFWSWDAKEVWALVTWLIYAGCLHLRHTRNFRGKYAAIMAVIGFVVIIFTYIGVNLVFPATIHSYS